MQGTILECYSYLADLLGIALIQDIRQFEDGAQFYNGNVLFAGNVVADLLKGGKYSLL